jgi:proteasome lid subunit RPN8/RPN11
MSRRVVFKRSVVDSILSYSRMCYPEEGILLLRGKKKGDTLEVESVVVPPGATHGKNFSSFSWFFLPPDTRYVGVAHSHPSGSVEPSHQDILHASGSIMVISGYPFENESCISVYDTEGRRIEFGVED